MLPYPKFLGVVSTAARQTEQRMHFCAVCLAYLRFIHWAAVQSVYCGHSINIVFSRLHFG